MAQSVWDQVQVFVGAIDSSWSRGDYGSVLDLCREGLPLIGPLAEDHAAQPWGKGVAFQYPLVDRLLIVAPPALDEQSLLAVTRLAASHNMPAYGKVAAEAICALPQIEAVYRGIAANPGIIQKDIRPSAADVLYVADRLGIVRRKKAGVSYALTLLVDLAVRPLR